MNKILRLLIVLVVGFHLLSLDRLPTPMYDQVFFQDITLSWMNEGAFLLKAAPDLYGHEIIFYGPLYFVLQAGISKIIGSGIWEFRLLNMLCGITLLLLLYRMALQFRVNKSWALLMLLFILMENVFGNLLHSGRMDFVAELLMLSGLYALFLAGRIPAVSHRHTRLILAGLAIGMALITTPRIVFFAPGILLLFFVHMRKHKWMELLIPAIFIAAPFLTWVFAYVGFQNYVEWMQHPIVKGHIGSGFGWRMLIRQWYNAPLVGLFFWGMWKEGLWMWSERIRKKDNSSEEDRSVKLFKLSLYFSCLLFFFLVEERAPYSGMLYPIILFLILSSTTLPKPSKLIDFKSYPSLFQILVPLQLLFIAAIFLVKASALVYTWEARNPVIADRFMKTVDSPTIYGNSMYFYAAIDNDKKFLFLRHAKELEPKFPIVDNQQKEKGWISTLSTVYKPQLTNAQ